MSDTDQPQPAPLHDAAPDTAPATSASLSRRHILMGAGMLAVGGVAYARMPGRRFPDISDETFEAMFPKTFGDWAVLPASELVMPPESELANKLYQHILTRTYVNGGGDAVMFLIAYNSEQVNNVQVHRPEICYSASGFKIARSMPYTLDLGRNETVPARMVRAERASRMENIVYWTRIGEEFPQSWLAQRIAMTKANLSGFYADGLLVRASAIDNDTDKSVALIADFLRQLAADCPPDTRELIFRA